MSNVQRLQWSSPEAAGPLLPWPQRPLPLVRNPSSDVQAFFLPAPLHGGGSLRIGPLPPVRYSESTNAILPKTTDLRRWFYFNPPGSPPLSFAVYRFAVGDAGAKAVSRDVVQVSPLMESIAVANVGFDEVEVRDPFIRFVQEVPNVPNGIYLLDTQPVVELASYRYLLVRFDANGEMVDVIPTAPVDIPPAP